MSKTITAVFKTRHEAETALSMLEKVGFTEEQVTIIVTEETHGKHFGIGENSKIEKGAAPHATIGGLAGKLCLGLASAGVLLVPGLNVIIYGAAVSGRAGLGAGVAAGGLIGTLVGLVLPEHEAKHYEDAVRNGAILITVEASDTATASIVMAILKDDDAQNVKAHAGLEALIVQK